MLNINEMKKIIDKPFDKIMGQELFDLKEYSCHINGYSCNEELWKQCYLEPASKLRLLIMQMSHQRMM